MEKIIKALIIIFCLLSIGFCIYVLAEYGSRPITEIPSWAVPFFIK